MLMPWRSALKPQRRLQTRPDNYRQRGVHSLTSPLSNMPTGRYDSLSLDHARPHDHDHPHSHTHLDDELDSFDTPSEDRTHRPLRVGIGGPVGSGKTAVVAALCRTLAHEVSMGVV